MITDAQPTKLNDSVSHGCIRDCEHLRVHHDSAKPLIYKNISNIVQDGMPIGGLGNAEANWHSDMTYIEDPPPASVLLGVEIPPEGGDTWFADQYAAFNALPESLRERIADLSIKHHAAHTSIGKLRPGFEAFDDSRGRFDIRFYLVAILFIIFDLEIAFLFPWAVSLGAIGVFGFWSMMVFLGVLTVGFVYEWKKGALEWD